MEWCLEETMSAAESSLPCSLLVLTMREFKHYLWGPCLYSSVVQQSLDSNGTQSPGNPLSVCTEGKLTGAERFKRVSNSEGNRGAFVWSSLPRKAEKWKHISPLTAAVGLTPCAELLMLLYGVEVDRRGVPEACCVLSEIRLNQAALVHTHAWEKPWHWPQPLSFALYYCNQIYFPL